MKALVVVQDSDKSVQFLWHDVEFLERLTKLSEDAPRMAMPSNDPSENGQCLEALLPPLIVSYELLQEQFDDPVTVIVCKEVGCNVVFQHHDNLFYIGFCAISHFSVYHMQKELCVLKETVEFFYGPCQDSVNPRNWIDKSRTWKKIADAIHSFIELHESEPSFLVGGVEKLHFNSDLQQYCSRSMESCLPRQLRKEKISHALLFVKNKLAAYKVGAKVTHQLSTADVLKIITIINSKFKQLDEIDMMDASSAVEAIELSSSDEDDSTSHDLFGKGSSGLHRSETMPKRKSSMQPRARVRFADLVDTTPNSYPEDRKLSISMIPEEGSHFSAASFRKRTISENGDDTTLLDSDNIEISDEVFKSVQIRRRKSMPTVVQEEIGRQTSSLKIEIHTVPVFLHTMSCQYTPFSMHSIRPADDVNFIVLSESKYGDVATIICKFLSLLKKIKFKPNKASDATKGSLILEVQGGMKTYEKIKNCCKELERRLRNASDTRQIRRINSMWEKISEELMKFMKHQKIRSLNRLDFNVSELSFKLQELFKSIFLLKPAKSRTAIREELELIAEELDKCFRDYLDFFRAKALRNLAVEWNYQQYPGLLHFILVKRLKPPEKFMETLSNSGPALLDQVYTSGLYIPDLSEDNEVVSNDIRLYVKNQVSRGVLAAYSQLNEREGVSHISVTEGDFTVTSYFWVRPPDVHALSLDKKLSSYTWRGKTSLTGFESPLWSVKSVDRSNGPFLFFELHLVHFSTVPEKVIAEQADKLLVNLKNNKVEV